MKYVMMAWFGSMTMALQAQTGQEEIALFSAAMSILGHVVRFAGHRYVFVV